MKLKDPASIFVFLESKVGGQGPSSGTCLFLTLAHITITFVESGDKLEKFIRRIERMIDMLEEHHADQHIASNINQFYYVQKLEELKQFQESIQQTAERVRFFASQFESEYTLVYTRWKNDVRWLNTMRILSRKYAGGGPPYKGPADEDHTYG